jgi:hypothetical protein
MIGFTGSLIAAAGSRLSRRWRRMNRTVIGSPSGAE